MSVMRRVKQNATRIFVAVGPSKPLREKILEWQLAHSKLGVRWIAGKNLHVTLIPPWYENDPEETKELLHAVQQKYHQIPLTFERVTFGPDPRRPRLIWAEGDAPEALLALKTNLEAALRRAPEKRPFRLHLTLARFRPEDYSRLPLKRLDEPVLWQDAVSSFLLMESRLTRAGADYKILEEIPL